MKTKKIELTNWKTKDISSCVFHKKNNTFSIENNNNVKSEYLCRGINLDGSYNFMKVKFDCKVKNAGGCLYINDVNAVPAQSESFIDIKKISNLKFRLEISAESSINDCTISIEFTNEYEDYCEKCKKNLDVLVVVPNYPSYENLYYCVFAHSRNKEYVKSGLKVQVVAVSQYYNYQTFYEIDKIPVLKCNYQSLKTMLSKHQYKVIVTHFVDENLYPIYEGYVSKNEKMVFICHGPETVFRYLKDVTRPYFTPHIKQPIIDPIFDLKENYVRKFANKENVEWVFVSDWLKEFSEKQLNINFKNCRVINNVINEELFPYVEKKEDDRFKILIIRKFDNIIQHSIDQCVMAILELSKKIYFEKLDFEIYGDGNYYNTLIAPLKQFSNVHLHRTFIPNNKISDIHKNAGIIMLPSRHDAHAVAMGEAASSGLVVVGSNVTSNPFFMNDEENHILCDPEDFKSLAGIIDRLYNNPDEFLKISKNLASITHKRCCKKNTVYKEIELIKQLLEKYTKTIEPVNCKPVKNPVLTVVVPAYNVEKYLDKCISSMIYHKNAKNMEIIIVNDGSKDNTLKIAKKYEKATNGIVKVIDKENGGHGSTINCGIKAAKGKYFRLVDGDDWVDSENLSKLIDIMKQTDVDLILTKGSYEYIEESKLSNIIDYDMLEEGIVYDFDNLIYNGYGFKTYGPLLTTANYKTELLKKADFKISEKKPYVDMEFNAFSLRFIKSVVHYKLDIYRYLIGREGQTVSRDFWRKKYKDHEYIIFNILKTLDNVNDYSSQKIYYVYKNIIAQMVDSQIFMFDALCLWEKLDEFLNNLSSWEYAYKISIDNITEKNHNSRLILQEYKKYIKKYSNAKQKREPIIIPGVRETVLDLNNDYHYLESKNVKWFIKKSIKAICPYGILKIIYMLRNRRK